MLDNKTVLEWVQELGTQALTEAKEGDRALLNRITANASIKLFVDNVIGLKSVAAHAFPAYYAGAWKEITAVCEAYQQQEKVNATVDKVATLEAKLDAMAAQLATLIEASKPVETTKKPAKKSAKVENEIEAVEPVEDTQESDAESEA